MELLEQEWLKHPHNATEESPKQKQTKTNSTKSTSPTKKHKDSTGEKAQLKKSPKQHIQKRTESEQDNESKNNGVQNNESYEAEEEQIGRFVRNPIWEETARDNKEGKKKREKGSDGNYLDDALVEELEQQERDWETIEAHEEEAERATHKVMEEPHNRRQMKARVFPKHALARANVKDARTAKRIAPAGALDVPVGRKKARRIPRR